MTRHFAWMIAFAVVGTCGWTTLGQDQEDEEPKPRQLNPQRIQLRIPAGVAIRGRMNNQLNLLSNKKVQDELKLDEEQLGKLKEMQAVIREQTKEFVAALRGAQGEDRRAKIAELQKKLRDKSAEAVKTVRTALKPEQTARLDEIALQLRGVRALTEVKLAKKLELSEEQQAELKETFSAAQKKRVQMMQDILGGNGGDRTKLAAKLAEITKESETKALDVLSDEQKTQFEKLKGEKFDLPRRGVQFRPARIQPGQLRRIQVRPRPARPAQPKADDKPDK